MSQPRPPTTDPGIELTFGIEIECYVALHLDAEAQHTTAREYLHDAFCAAGLPTTESADPTNHDYRTWLVTVDASLDRWHNGQDIAAYLPHLKEAAMTGDYNAYGVELVSRPMPVPSVASFICPAEQPQMLEVKKYMSILKGEPIMGAPHGTFVNDGCGFHVHFGRPDGSPLPLGVLRQFAYLCLLWEGTINSIHPRWRTPYPGTLACQYCDSNRKGFQLDDHSCFETRQCLLSLAEIRRRIFDPSKILRDLAWMMGTDAPLCAEGHVLWTGENCVVCSREVARAPPCQRCHSTGIPSDTCPEDQPCRC